MEMDLVAEATVVMAQMGSTRSFSGSFIQDHSQVVLIKAI